MGPRLKRAWHAASMPPCSQAHNLQAATKTSQQRGVGTAHTDMLLKHALRAVPRTTAGDCTNRSTIGDTHTYTRTGAQARNKCTTACGAFGRSNTLFPHWYQSSRRFHNSPDQGRTTKANGGTTTDSEGKRRTGVHAPLHTTHHYDCSHGGISDCATVTAPATLPKGRGALGPDTLPLAANGRRVRGRMYKSCCTRLKISRLPTVHRPRPAGKAGSSTVSQCNAPIRPRVMASQPQGWAAAACLRYAFGQTDLWSNTNTAKGGTSAAVPSRRYTQ